jgi:hypothetical protein
LVNNDLRDHKPRSAIPDQAAETQFTILIGAPHMKTETPDKSGLRVSASNDERGFLKNALLNVRGLAVAIVLVASVLVAWHVVAQVRAKSYPPRDYRNLKKLATACYMYAEEHSGSYPGNWGDVIPYSTRADAHIHGTNPADEPSFTNLTAWADYVYISGLTTGSPPEWVLAFGRPKHDREGEWIPTLFVGGNVQYLEPSEFTNALYSNPNHKMEHTAHDVR